MADEHKALIGRSDRELKMIAADATHQHYKGGLYRLLGTLKDADTGEDVLGKDGFPRIVYEHVYPYKRALWLRDSSEFLGTVLDLTDPDVENRNTQPDRFRPLS